MDEHRRGDDDNEFALREFFSVDLRALCTWRNALRFVATVFTVFAIRRFGTLAGILIGFFLILWNLRYNGTGDGISAYSVFNRGVRHLLGDLRPADIDRQLRNAGPDGDESDDDILVLNGPRVAGVHRSRDANKRCPCGSGKKIKRCCGRD
ncbi:hypothetical protein TGPRC2_254340 [Toxoplasma gondii TgCatPRC2]|uniref:SAYSvFN domain-containing protein n=15 Tax=Toxoplasma gondii TaxID=5811 RepID=B9PWX4_TOXGV|nr:hypothetical protein TGME49_254340 [Toxoplasma gondii ME49]EPR59070.1 hypothetical protein TGGT1_254340 [Toxoplasma gondii GT1]ESS30275.1 hypothetical protein TGVEG_254340 [Toxoplasma gondii VEG]KAF4645299.1 hypothetical protein TGRH88_004010 [Toxoplasma gondii]KFG35498.1 hypothetical protein TGDOM2_254340 [Toxoplasma gondii GAB2-2007-GAL-DOM2]KFG46843.1 hypothetical protein TGP89_254340 [Toxoplasma gondii p89]KFG53011.1 hypothetical protein TGFOU_254340 [Toxoplasma gondii FOU]KFG59981.1 |eukprot:XP_002369488.1 hypothetical protein TGME49_254340 [Toxoplasma gondii ME49]